MFGFIKRLLSRRTTQSTTTAPAADAPTAPGTTLHHDPALIDRLTEDHVVLLRLFGDIAAAQSARNQARIRDLLHEFDHQLREHLLLENTRLYIYLQHKLERGSEEWRTMHDFQHEMRDIGKAVTAFLDRYDVTYWDDELMQRFGTELGGMLQARIEAEEARLYPRYTA